MSLKHIQLATSAFVIILASHSATAQDDPPPETAPPLEDHPPTPSQTAEETEAPSTPDDDATSQQDAADDGPIEIQDRPMYEGYYWNLNLVGGWAPWTNADLEHAFVGRIRAGVLKIREPWFGALDASFDYGGLVGLGGGVHVELIHLWSGLWGQLFVALANDVELVTGVSAGWSIAGVEFQLCPTRDNVETLLLLKLRIPIGVLTYGLTHF